MTLRNRVVTEQDGEQHVSNLLLTTDEIPAQLALEETLHRAGGWEVQRFGAMLRCEKQTAVRWVWVRSRPPMEDTL